MNNQFKITNSILVRYIRSNSFQFERYQALYILTQTYSYILALGVVFATFSRSEEISIFPSPLKSFLGLLQNPVYTIVGSSGDNVQYVIFAYLITYALILSISFLCILKAEKVKFSPLGYLNYFHSEFIFYWIHDILLKRLKEESIDIPLAVAADTFNILISLINLYLVFSKMNLESLISKKTNLHNIFMNLIKIILPLLTFNTNLQGNLLNAIGLIVFLVCLIQIFIIIKFLPEYNYFLLKAQLSITIATLSYSLLQTLGSMLEYPDLMLRIFLIIYPLILKPALSKFERFIKDIAFHADEHSKPEWLVHLLSLHNSNFNLIDSFDRIHHNVIGNLNGFLLTRQKFDALSQPFEFKESHYNNLSVNLIKSLFEKANLIHKGNTLLGLTYIRLLYIDCSIYSKAYLEAKNLARLLENDFNSLASLEELFSDINERLSKNKETSNFDSDALDQGIQLRKFKDLLMDYCQNLIIFYDHMARRIFDIKFISDKSSELSKKSKKIEDYWKINQWSLSNSNPQSLFYYGIFSLVFNNYPDSGKKLLRQSSKIKEVLRMKMSNEEKEKKIFFAVGASKENLGKILFSSESTKELLGYDTKTIIGLNINIILPETFSKHHQEYLVNYMETGRSHIINIQRDFIAKHSNGNLIPISLLVTVETSIEQGVFFQAIVNIVDEKDLMLIDEKGRIVEVSHSMSHESKIGVGLNIFDVFQDTRSESGVNSMLKQDNKKSKFTVSNQTYNNTKDDISEHSPTSSKLLDPKIHQFKPSNPKIHGKDASERAMIADQMKIFDDQIVYTKGSKSRGFKAKLNHVKTQSNKCYILYLESLENIARNSLVLHLDENSPHPVLQDFDQKDTNEDSKTEKADSAFVKAANADSDPALSISQNERDRHRSISLVDDYNLDAKQADLQSTGSSVKHSVFEKNYIKIEELRKCFNKTPKDHTQIFIESFFFLSLLIIIFLELFLYISSNDFKQKVLNNSFIITNSNERLDSLMWIWRFAVGYHVRTQGIVAATPIDLIRQKLTMMNNVERVSDSNDNLVKSLSLFSPELKSLAEEPSINYRIFGDHGEYVTQKVNSFQAHEMYINSLLRFNNTPTSIAFNSNNPNLQELLTNAPNEMILQSESFISHLQTEFETNRASSQAIIDTIINFTIIFSCSLFAFILSSMARFLIKSKSLYRGMMIIDDKRLKTLITYLKYFQICIKDDKDVNVKENISIIPKNLKGKKGKNHKPSGTSISYLEISKPKLPFFILSIICLLIIQGFLTTNYQKVTTDVNRFLEANNYVNAASRSRYLYTYVIAASYYSFTSFYNSTIENQSMDEIMPVILERISSVSNIISQFKDNSGKFVDPLVETLFTKEVCEYVNFFQSPGRVMENDCSLITKNYSYAISGIATAVYQEMTAINSILKTDNSMSTVKQVYTKFNRAVGPATYVLGAAYLVIFEQMNTRFEELISSVNASSKESFLIEVIVTIFASIIGSILLSFKLNKDDVFGNILKALPYDQVLVNNKLKKFVLSQFGKKIAHIQSINEFRLPYIKNVSM